MDDLWLKSTAFLGQSSANTFKIVIQLGSILAVVVIFWKRIWSLLGFYRQDGEKVLKRFNLLHVIVGMLPAVVIGFALKNLIDIYLFGTKTVIFALIAGAILMMVTDRFAPKIPKATSLDEITYKQAFSVA